MRSLRLSPEADAYTVTLELDYSNHSASDFVVPDPRLRDGFETPSWISGPMPDR